MDTKSRPQTVKIEARKPRVEAAMGARETVRLFLDVDQVRRRSQTVPLSRYVE